MLLGALLSGVAWVYLVRAAIAFGRLARCGQAQAWLFTIAASLGAVVCAVLVLVLVARALRKLGLISDYKPRRAAPGRRAAAPGERAAPGGRAASSGRAASGGHANTGGHANAGGRREPTSPHRRAAAPGGSSSTHRHTADRRERGRRSHRP